MRTLLIFSCAAGSLLFVSPAAAKIVIVEREPLSVGLWFSINDGDMTSSGARGNQLTMELDIPDDRQTASGSITQWHWATEPHDSPFARDSSTTNIQAAATWTPASGTTLPDTLLFDLEFADGDPRFGGPIILSRQVQVPVDNWRLDIENIQPTFFTLVQMDVALRSDLDLVIFDELVNGEPITVTAHRIESLPVHLHLQIPEPSSVVICLVLAAVAARYFHRME